MQKMIDEGHEETQSLVKKTSRLEREAEAERNKTRRLEHKAEAERNKTKKEMAKLVKELVETTNRLECEVERTDRLECEVEAERKKTSKLVERTSTLECEVELERNKTSELKKEVKGERRKRQVLELDMDNLNQSTNVIASWIVAGVLSNISYISFLFTHSSISSAGLKMVVNPSDEYNSRIFWIAFKQG